MYDGDDFTHQEAGPSTTAAAASAPSSPPCSLATATENQLIIQPHASYKRMPNVGWQTEITYERKASVHCRQRSLEWRNTTDLRKIITATLRGSVTITT